MSLWHQRHLCSSVCFMLRLLVVILHTVLSLLTKVSLLFHLYDMCTERNLIRTFWRIYDINAITGKRTERIVNAVLCWCLIKAKWHKLPATREPNLLRIGIQQCHAQQLALTWLTSVTDWDSFCVSAALYCALFTDEVFIRECLFFLSAYTVLVLLK